MRLFRRKRREPEREVHVPSPEEIAAALMLLEKLWKGSKKLRDRLREGKQ
jgi:hypothetical protein